MESKKLVEIFKALGSETRLRIFSLLNRSLKESRTLSEKKNGKKTVVLCMPGSKVKNSSQESCCELCVCDIIKSFPYAQSTISHHLDILYRSGLLNRRKEAQWVHYSINLKTLEVLRKYIGNKK